jgi:hypothetical protein
MAVSSLKRSGGVTEATAGASVILWSIDPLVTGPFSPTDFRSNEIFGFESSSFTGSGPSTMDCRGCAMSSTFHHRGLASTLHRAHLRSAFGTVGSADSSFMTIPAFGCLPFADVGVCAVIAEALRFVCGGTTWGTIRVVWSTRLALRAVPVRVRSACLNSLAKSCKAIMSVPSTCSFIG